MVFDDRFLEELRLRADIVDVISSYIPLKKAGANFKALCPFHKEKTPSFTVSPEKQIFHCFGCGKGGNVFNFVMEQESLTFPEAVEFLANKYNMALPGRGSGSKQNSIKTADAYSVNAYAAKFYHKQLFSAKGKPGLEYLSARGLSIDTIKRFTLGFAPDSWDALITDASRNRISLKALFDAGLILKSQNNNKAYDRFRNRIIFPVFAPNGKAVGFGARVLDDSLPKYINSPETRLFKKSNLLYGLHLAKNQIKEDGFAVLVEGYMDVIALHQAGISNAIATLGTAFTEGHALLLKRYASKVVMVFDSDEAGLNATMRGAQSLLASDISVRVLRLEGAKDPDEFIKAFGADRFKESLANAVELFEFLMQVLSRQYDLSDSKEKNNFLKTLFELIKVVDNSIIRSDYLFKLAEYAHLKPALVEQAFAAYIGKQRPFRKAGPDNERKAIQKLFFSAEKEALALAMSVTALKAREILERLSAVDFSEPEFLELWELLSDMLEQGIEVSLSSVMAEAQNRGLALEGFFSSCMKRPSIDEASLDRHMEKIFSALEKSRLDKQIKLVKAQIDKASREGNKEEEEALIGHLNFLFKQKGGVSLGKGRI